MNEQVQEQNETVDGITGSMPEMIGPQRKCVAIEQRKETNQRSDYLFTCVVFFAFVFGLVFGVFFRASLSNATAAQIQIAVLNSQKAINTAEDIGEKLAMFETSLDRESSNVKQVVNVLKNHQERITQLASFISQKRPANRPAIDRPDSKTPNPGVTRKRISTPKKGIK